MSGLSAEALALLDGADLQELRGGSSFTPIAETRQIEAPDLSSEELAGLRSWDLSGVIARLKGLSFVEPASAPMPEMEESAAPAPVTEGGLPDWLKPAEEAAPPTPEEATEPTPVSEESAEPSTEPGGPTAEEVAAGLAAAEAAGPGTQVVDREEVVIQPAGEETPAAVEAEAKKGLAEWLKKIDFGKLAKEGVRYLIPPLTGLTLGRLLPPEQAWNLTQTAFAVGMLGFVGFGGCAVAERVVFGHPRVAGIARLLAAGKVIGAVFAETGMLMSAGSFAGGLWHGREIVRQAAAQMGQAGARGGEGLGDHHPRLVDASAGQFGGVSLDERGESVVQSPVLSPQASEFVNRAGEVAAQEAQEMADAAKGAAEIAARQAALDVATRTVTVNPGDTLTELVARAGGDPYGADFTNTVLQSADVLTGPQNPNQDMARALVEFIKAHPGGVNWRDAINGVGAMAKEVVGGVPLKDAIAAATRMIYPGQEMKVVVGAGV